MEINRFCEIDYIIKYPQNYIEGGKYPVLFFLHGAGTRGNDINLLKSNPFFEITDKHKDFPFVTVAPQCSKNTWFDCFNDLLSLAQEVYEMPFSDKKRFYGIGASMGGYGIWQMAMSLPEIFAGIVPICGGGMYWNAGQLENVPVWAFHGDSDETVLTRESEKMVEAVKNCGGDAKLTVYENCGHDAWSETYGNTEVFNWLLSHSKQDEKELTNKYNNSKLYG